MDIDFSPNAKVRYLEDTRHMCQEQHAVLEFVAEKIVQVAQEAVDTGVPYLEDPLTARLFVDKYRLEAGMDSLPTHITVDSAVKASTMDSASEEGEASSQGFSDQGTNTKSRTNSSDHERALNHSRGEGMRIRGMANERRFGRERNVNSFSTKPSSRTLSTYQEEPRHAESKVPTHPRSPKKRLRVPETYIKDDRTVKKKGKKGRVSHGSKRVAVLPHCYRCLEEFPDKDTMFRHVRQRVCRQEGYNRRHQY